MSAADAAAGRSSKRARFDPVATSGSVQPPAEEEDAHIGALRQLCLKRDTLARWCTCSFFDKVVRGKLVWVSAAAGGQHELHVVLGLDHASEAYALDFTAATRDVLAEGARVTGGSGPFTRLEKKKGDTSAPAPPGYDRFRVSTSLKLKTARANTPAVDGAAPTGRKSTQTIRLSSVSNSAPSAAELAAVQSSPSSALPDAAAAVKAVETWTRLKAEAAAGLGAVVLQEGQPSASAGSSAVQPGGAVWGDTASQTGHHVLLILRSWLAQDAIDEERGVGIWKEGGSDGGAEGQAVAAAAQIAAGAETSSSSAFIPEIFRPCVEAVGEGRGVDDYGYGPGPLRTLERVAGQYRYLLQHRADVAGGAAASTSSSSSATVLHALNAALVEGGLPPPSSASPQHFLAPLALASTIGYDEGQPTLTAWRAVRQYVDDSIPLALLRDSIVAQVDVRSASGGGGAVKTQQAWLSSTAHALTDVLHGPVVVYLLDADVLAHGVLRATRSGGGEESSAGSRATTAAHVLYSRLAHTAQERAWLRTLTGQQPGSISALPASASAAAAGACAPSSAPASASKCPNRRVAKLIFDTQRKESKVAAQGLYRDGSWGDTCGCTALTATGLLWFDEDQLECLVRGGCCEASLRAAAGSSKTGAGSTTARVPMHPLLQAALLPCSVEHPSVDVALDSPPAGSGLYEEGALPDAHVLSEALVQQSKSGIARKRLFALEQTAAAPVAAHELQPWPPWPVYPLHSTGETAGTAVTFNPAWCPALFPHRNGRHCTVMCHGTSTSMASSIAKEGFRRALCRMTDECKSGRCDDQMLGFGTYFGDWSKAFEYAVKRAAYDSGAQTSKGSVVMVRVDVGHVQCATPVQCPCGCGQAYVDHYGSWYAQAGHDTLYLRDNSLPAARTREWAVADPARTVVAGLEDAVTGIFDERTRAGFVHNL